MCRHPPSSPLHATLFPYPPLCRSDVRPRDVQLRFAGAATGAHSTALVSQGRIGAIINAKPQDRRNLLEEAAGITGLHSRRHEAELRLRAAETNLERLDDVIATLAAQTQGLKKHARQSTRSRHPPAQHPPPHALPLPPARPHHRGPPPPPAAP